MAPLKDSTAMANGFLDEEHNEGPQPLRRVGQKQTLAATNGETLARVAHKQASATDGHTDTRTEMLDYWKVYSPSLESMMLSHDAPRLSTEEEKEIMAYLPKGSCKSSTILELGAGIGRFTSLLCKAGAKHVTAVDFMESFTEENRKTNQHYSNTTFLCADVTKLSFPNQSFDLVFTNWLLMYLSDNEVEALLKNALAWLKPDGYLFIRESCYHSSGNMARQSNPTRYRTPLQYMNIFTGTRNQSATFTVIKAKNIVTYIKCNNPNQLCFLLQRRSVQELNGYSNHETENQVQESSLQQLQQQPSSRAEGRLALVIQSRLEHLESKNILDFECGNGDLAFLLAKQGAHVHGLTWTPEGLHNVIYKHSQQEHHVLEKVKFELQTSMEDWSSTDKYDLVCARINTANDNNGLGKNTLENIKDCLKEDGRLLLCSYSAHADEVMDIFLSDLSTTSILQVSCKEAGLKLVSMNIYQVSPEGLETSQLEDALDCLSLQNKDYNRQVLTQLSKKRPDTSFWCVLEATN